MLLGLLASAAAIVAASLIVGHAVLIGCSRPAISALAGPVGLAALLSVAAITVRLPGDSLTALLGLAALVVVSTVVVAGSDAPRRLRRAGAGTLAPPLIAGALAAVVASVPFIAAWQVGILGVGLVNDDMASHLLIASWLDERFLPEPVFIDQGYPLGPHAIAAALARALPGSAGLVEAFAGLTLAIPALTALVAYGALAGVGTSRPRLDEPVRVLAAALVALPYLAAAYLAQEAFKEPIEALLVLGFALLLPSVRGARDGVPLGLLAAGALYVYSFPGVGWLAGSAIAYGAFARWRARRSQAGLRALPAVGWMPLAVAVALLLLASAPEWGRLADFTDFRALDPDRANEGGLGNLPGHISPLEALGIWPTSEFRLPAGGGALPAIAFYAGALLALTAFATALPRWIRVHGPAIPLALVTALALFLAARVLGTAYTSAKALAIASPLIILISLGGLLEREPGVSRGRGAAIRRPSAAGTRGPGGGWLAHRPPNRLRLALAAALALGAAASSFLILRQAPVAPADHMADLAEIRPLVEGEKVLFLGRDNFVLYELRGSKPFTHVRNFYDPYFVRPNFELKRVASKFDFDSVTASTLARFPFVITTRAAYASGPPPGYEAALETSSYVLWRQGGSTVASRRPGEGDEQPAKVLECGGGGHVDFVVPTAAVFSHPPQSGEAGAWSPAATVGGGDAANQTLRLGTGRWNLSLQYDSTRTVSVSAPGLNETLPANLDFRGEGPFWPAGQLDVPEGGEVPIEVEVESPPLAGRLLGADSVAHLGAIAATPAGGGYAGAIEPAPGAGERLLPIHRACGRYLDWAGR